MYLTKSIKAIDLALYLKDHHAVIFSDIHLGYEEALAAQGLLLPRRQLQQTLDRFENTVAISVPKGSTGTFSPDPSVGNAGEEGIIVDYNHDGVPDFVYKDGEITPIPRAEFRARRFRECSTTDDRCPTSIFHYCPSS